MKAVSLAGLGFATLLSISIQAADCEDESGALDPTCVKLDPITIIGTKQNARDVAGGASVVSADELQEFETTDVVRALRRVPGVSLQMEDGYGLRPNISIRGTATERSSRITLLEDNVLIAPAPYAAPAAYYFPTFGRVNAMEVLKGPAAITQGPYTIGGAINLISTPIPVERKGLLQIEGGSDSTWRGHAWYGDNGDRSGWLVETHQWKSDGYQTIDRNDGPTGLDKQDYMAKFSISSDPAARVYQQLDIKLQSSEEDSEQTYLGLTDADFGRDPARRYGLSALDNMHNEHQQVMLNWRIEPALGTQVVVTAYHNDFERAWYKTEGIDFDGSNSSPDWSGSGWSSVIRAVNTGDSLAGQSTDMLQAILDGGDTAEGAVKIRNNARTYDSGGIQIGLNQEFQTGTAIHHMRVGLRYHEDEEDRMQRDDTYQQTGGALLLSSSGPEGGAGNRIVEANAWAAYIHDRIEWDRWTLTPGIRFESIEQTRTDYNNKSADPSSRDPGNLKRFRRNKENVWIPGIGALYDVSSEWKLLAGVHKGFSSPGNQDGVDPEESINYELGLRFGSGPLDIEAIAFFNDYDNLQGICTASSGSDCDIGDVFNGDAVSIAGLEFQLRHDFAASSDYRLPLMFTYTWMNAEFDGDIGSTEFFGDVHKGDPVPYIPDHQAFVSVGFEKGQWATYLSMNYVDSTCTVASCGPFEKTDSAAVFDLGVHYRITPEVELYSVLENLTDEQHIAARQPYGGRAGKNFTWMAGARIDF
jgi:Fe(3+) dicitrate transport protein